MDIVYSSTELLNIKRLTVVNGNACYKIEVKDKEGPCKHKFVCTLQSTKFIAIIHDGNLHIFNLMQDQDGIFPEDFRSYIDANRMKILNLSGSFQIDGFNWKNPHNLVIVIPYSPPCDHQFLDLTVAKDIIRALNAKLQPTCHWFNLHIDYLTSFPTGSTVSMYSTLSLNSFMRPPLLLCLMHRNECVSSIEMVVRNEKIIDIYSETDARCKRRGFNILLRAVAIMISKDLSESAEKLNSSAANIISALLMIKHFNAVSQEGDISKFTISPEKLDKVIKDYFHQHDDSMVTMVELNDDNIANAMTVFHKTIEKIDCRSISVRRHRSASPARSRSRSRSRARSCRKTTSVRSAPTGGKRKTITMKNI
uniref:Uncharacterized protein n=1 Tax=viral metagenome TaxID=1070528 RepID=A0A6C0I4B6_9ZZZZ